MAFNIWRITDGKAGHDSQSIGLCNAIEKIKVCQRFDIVADSFLNNYKNLLLKQFPLGRGLPDPNIIIGAGHGCHLSMLAAKRASMSKAVVLMKPSLPLSFFDACIIPKHDQAANKKNVIVTSGALNPIEFNPDKSANMGLILLGGPSKHYQWLNESILDQIKEIVTNNAEIHWSIADSPRTPETILDRIANSDYKNVDVLNIGKTGSETIREFIFKAGNIWVSRDSVSMVYEALSSGAAVGLLDLEQKNKNRISDAINSLIDEKQLNSFDRWKNTNNLVPASFKFNEAERCASLLLEKEILV